MKHLTNSSDITELTNLSKFLVIIMDQLKDKGKKYYGLHHLQVKNIIQKCVCIG